MNPKIAVVGAGYWGKNLARNFYELGDLEVICDANNLLEENYKKKYPDIHFTTSYRDVLDDKTIEAIVIATPAATHFTLAMEAFMAGKHVFVEKPLALRVEEGERLVSFAREQSRILMVGHILQYHNAILKLKELIDNGELGKLEYLCSNRLSIGKIRTEENILWSFAPHDISVILMLLNEEPEKIYATGGNYLQQQVADVTLTTMDFPSGVKAHIFVSWLHPFKEQKLVVIGDKKMAVFDDVSHDKLLLYPHKVQWLQRAPVASKAEAEVVHVDKAEPLKAECQHFIKCIKNGHTPKTDGHEGLGVLRVLEASQESLDNHGKIVQLNKHKKLKELDKLGYFVHESAYVDEDTNIGGGTSIWHFSHVLKGSRIGQNCRIGQNVVIGPNVTIGNGCKIQNNVSVYKGVTLQDHVFCGPSMVFTNATSFVDLLWCSPMFSIRVQRFPA
jgi:UDP-2-acetamido-3-amino-2,3-dideoxy-glucuronate N-acetyltransferase